MDELWEKPREYVEVREPLNRRYLGYSVLLGVVLALIFALFLKVYAYNKAHQRQLKLSQAEAEYATCLGMAAKNKEVDIHLACLRWGYKDGKCPLGVSDTYKINGGFSKFEEDCKRRLKESIAEVWE